MKHLINTTIKTLFLITFLFILSCCGNTNNVNYKQDAQKAFDAISTSITDEVKLNDEIYYNELVDGFKVSYEYSKDNYISDYKVVKAEAYDMNLDIEIKLVKEKQEFIFNKKIKIVKDQLTYFKSVEEYIKSFIPEATRSDLRLKTTYLTDEIEIKYESNNQEFVTSNGEYIKHEYDENVVIKCTLKQNDEVYTFDINILSLGITNAQRLVKVKTWLDEYMEDFVVEEGAKLPDTHPQYGGTINWISNNPYIIYHDNIVHLPIDAGKYGLLAEIVFVGAYEIVKYEYDFPKTNKSETEIAIDFIKNVASEEFGEFLNLYNGATPVIDQSLNISDLSSVTHILNSGPHKEVSQDKLDELFYEGYTVKNDINLLWIVVHETGSTTVGTDALTHANYQMNLATGATDRNASWHYQVDDGKIYQSYDDSIACWHASDGSSPGTGNGNGIGIEMCVNADGRYNASMRNDARLIASLMLKYKLDIYNIKQHYDFAPDNKNCPEQMRNARRWFEFLNLIAREYISQQLLSKYDIEYSFEEEHLVLWKLQDIYQAQNLENKSINVNVVLNEEIFVINVVHNE